MKLLRVLRVLDDLAEVVLFDVMLATPKRRRLCALAAGSIGLAAYMSSGFWMAPATLPPSFERAAPIQSAMPGLPAEQVEIAADMVRVGKIDPSRQAVLEKALEYHRFELDRFVSLAGGTELQMGYTCYSLGIARVSTVATMLLARGIIYAHDEPSAAVRDWLTVLRMADVLQVPAVPERVAEHAVASVLTNTAVGLLDKVVRTAELMPAELSTINRMLTQRPKLHESYSVQFAFEASRLRSMLEHWAATNELPLMYRGLRFYLPVNAANRRAVAARAIEQIESRLHELYVRTAVGDAPPARAPVSIAHVAGWAVHLTPGAGWSDRVATLWSNDRAADVAATLILCWRPRAAEGYVRSCQATERAAAELAKECAAKLER